MEEGATPKQTTEASRKERNIKLAKIAGQQLIEYAEKGYHGEIIFHFKGGEVHQGDLKRTVKFSLND